EHCRASHPELLITDVKMPQLDGIEAAEQVCKDQPIPVILVSAYHDHELLGRAQEGHVMAYLVKPIEEADIEVAIGIAMRRFEQFQAVSKEASDLRQALENRKLIERAKGIVMKHSGLDEQGAFRRLHKMSWDQNRKLVEIARMILLAEEVFQPSDKSRGS
ncbi:MAG: ANTAR domain-containing protein, partial [Pirellulales bacterium]